MAEKVVKSTRATTAKTTEAVETEVVATETVTPEAPKKPEKRVILDTDLITVMNNTKGMYGYISPNGFYIDFNEYGDMTEVPMGELRKMASSTAKKHLLKPWIIVMDEDAIKELRLEKAYENIYTTQEVDTLLRDPIGFMEKFPKMPEQMKHTVLFLLRQELRDGKFYDMRVTKWLQETYQVDITE